MLLQHSIVFLVVVLSVAYLTYRAWKVFRESSDPCHGCPGCALRDKSGVRPKRLGKSMRKNMKPPCEGREVKK